jgi:hypothetical protein
LSYDDDQFVKETEHSAFKEELLISNNHKGQAVVSIKEFKIFATSNIRLKP